MTAYNTLAISIPSPYVYHVELNRPKKLNAFNIELWKELGDCFKELSINSDCRVVVLSAQGKHFTSGLDRQTLWTLGQKLEKMEDIAHRNLVLEQMLEVCQNSITSLEACYKPVISVVHGACVGAGMNLITAADIRYCTKDSCFELKEDDIGIAAYVGALQRLPKIIGNMSTVREICYTGCQVTGPEALEIGLVSKLFEDKESAIKGALEVAAIIAKRNPVAVQNTKRNLVYSLDRTNQEGLNHIKTLNQAMLQSEDFVTATMALALKSGKPACE